jgi:hypothetical protein
MKRFTIIAFLALLTITITFSISTTDADAAVIHLPLVRQTDVPTAEPTATPTLTPTLTPLPTATPLPTSTPLPTPIPQPIPVGESIVCHSMRVESVESFYTEQLGLYDAPQGGKILVVTAQVSNHGYEVDYISRFDIVVEDSSGHKFRMADLDFQWLAQEQYGQRFYGVYTDIWPTLSDTLTFAWVVAPNAQQLSFEPDTLCDLMSASQRSRYEGEEKARARAAAGMSITSSPRPSTSHEVVGDPLGKHMGVENRETEN